MPGFIMHCGLSVAIIVFRTCGSNTAMTYILPDRTPEFPARQQRFQGVDSEAVNYDTAGSFAILCGY